jgi:hypothetical protein
MPAQITGQAFGWKASRTAKAGAGEILIPEPLRHLLTGKSYVYADGGETMLKRLRRRRPSVRSPLARVRTSRFAEARSLSL